MSTPDPPDPTFWICETCAVEHAERPDVCAICADERQWTPAAGQRWTTLEQLAAAGHRTVVEELEPDLLGIEAIPKVGIGQQTKVVVTPDGLLLWDPIGFLDAAAVERIRAHGEVRAIAASHPHMYGVQVEWSRASGAPRSSSRRRTAPGSPGPIRSCGPGAARWRCFPGSR